MDKMPFSTSSLVCLSKDLTQSNSLEHLIQLHFDLKTGVELYEEEKEEFLEKLRKINEKLRELCPIEYHHFIINNPNIKNKRKEDDASSVDLPLMDIYVNTIVDILLTYTTKELEVYSSKMDQTTEGNIEKNHLPTKPNPNEMTDMSILCNCLFRIRSHSMSPFLLRCIGFLIEEEGIREFLNFIIKMDFKRKNSQLEKEAELLKELELHKEDDQEQIGALKQIEVAEEFPVTFLDHLQTIFLYIKHSHPTVYSSLLSIVHSEKRFFKVIIFRPLPDIFVDRIFMTLRDYNFDVIVSLFDRRPHLIEELIKRIMGSNINATEENTESQVVKIPRKSFIDKLIKYDTYFSPFLKKLDLSDDELMDICDKSDLCLNSFFVNRVGSMYSLCKVLANKKEEFVIEFIDRYKTHENMFTLIKNITYTIKLTGALKEYILREFIYHKDYTPSKTKGLQSSGSQSGNYFNLLLPLLSFDEINKHIRDFYEKTDTLSGLMRKYHSGDLLLEIHKLLDEETGRKLITEISEIPNEPDKNTKYIFSDSDYIFLLKALESAQCPFKFYTCHRLLTKNGKLAKSSVLYKPIVIFLTNCVNVPDEWYVKCLEEVENIKTFENIALVDILELYKHNEKIRKIIRKGVEKDSGKGLSKKMKDVKNEVVRRKI